MKRKWLMIKAATGGALILVFATLVWATLSRFSSGYEITNGKVLHRTYNNVNFEVDRKEVVGADPDSFTSLGRAGGRYGTDSTSVFFQETIISNADVPSFRVLDWRQKFSRDANHAYWRSIRVSDDPDNFHVLSRGYSKDCDHVYYASQIVEGDDPDTFVVKGPSNK